MCSAVTPRLRSLRCRTRVPGAVRISAKTALLAAHQGIMETARDVAHSTSQNERYPSRPTSRVGGRAATEATVVESCTLIALCLSR